MTDTKAREEAERIVRERGGICLVPLPGKDGLSSHEKTFCDCEIEDMLAEAIVAAERRGRVWAFREARQLYITHMGMDDMATRLSGFCVMLNAVANRIERGET